jgi:hypothetical protein
MYTTFEEKFFSKMEYATIPYSALFVKVCNLENTKKPACMPVDFSFSEFLSA